MNWASCAFEGPLGELRVLDFTALLPGPWATQVLADLGADVIKVEPPGGEEGRRFPSGLYAVANRNKRGVVANLKDAADRERVLELAAGADVVIEGYRPGVAARLGIGYAAVAAVRRDVIYCSLSGYGQTGPNRERAGHDLNFLAAAGGLAYSAHWGEPPRRSGVPVADLAGATHAVIAILAALRERDRGGPGCHLDVALADATLAFVAPRGGPGFAVRDEQRLGVYANNDVYAARDGALVAISAVEQRFFEKLRGALAPDLDDARFDDEDGRREHGDELKVRLERAFGRRNGADWVAHLTAHDVPAELVRTLAEAARSPQAAARGVIAELDGEEQVVFPVLRDGVVMGRFRSRAPVLSEPLGAGRA